ncbi:IclR family transcriptional regulator [Oceanobacillus piezotolerans]|uniref:IclR family transcriptional regulator n=1 Tax=Oceanobacillus piezotolerans TaxID=2448030 RepID=A0A498DB27_9BACI|nr:helix-turn-helix domain-containing protein [Oceanobacillus piezotolerans]RLL46894.1 IclR family transcriptional regulator [Oceanobacillus piezotolerans]
METKRKNDTIQSLRIGLSIIEVIAKEGRPLKVIEIQEKTQITKSNLYKYLNTLIQENFLFRDSETSMYHLGSKLIQYGFAAMGNQDILPIITPYLQSISVRTRSSVIFAVPTYNGPVIAKIWRSSQILNIGAELGTLLPPRSSSGKIFHAFSSKLMIDSWNKEKDLSLPENELEKIKKDKIAFANEPLISQISSVSIPILSFDKELIGIVTVVGFSTDIPSTPDSEFSQYLQEVQLEISGKF